MKYCNHKWFGQSTGLEVIKTCKTRHTYEIQTTPICLKCGMLQVYYEYISRFLKDRKPCKYCGGKGYI